MFACASAAVPLRVRAVAAFLRGDVASAEASRVGESLAHLLALRRDGAGRGDDTRLQQAAGLHHRVGEPRRREPDLLLPGHCRQQVSDGVAVMSYTCVWVDMVVMHNLNP